MKVEFKHLQTKRSLWKNGQKRYQFQIEIATAEQFLKYRKLPVFICYSSNLYHSVYKLQIEKKLI